MVINIQYFITNNNSSKKIRVPIGEKSSFYNSMETRNKHELLT